MSSAPSPDPAPRAALLEVNAPGHSRRFVALSFAVLFAFQITCLILEHPPRFEDDAAFFFRYADNLAAGHGFRWNVEEPPTWGASAPLWPMLIALGVKLGATAATASLVWSWLFTLGASGALGWVALRLLGPFGVLGLAPLLSINYLYSSYATSGMESPLTYALIAGALVVACTGARGLVIGVVAGLCLVHKLDLAPLGLALLAGTCVWRRREAGHALVVAGVIAVLWYGFATWHFGSPIPNSFLSKLHAHYGHLARGWLAQLLLMDGAGKVLLLFLPLGLFALRRQPFVAGLALFVVLVPTLGYALRPPSERFQWYAAGAACALSFLSGSGLGWLLRAIAGRDARPGRLALASAALVPLSALLVRLESPRIRGWQAYVASIESALIDAGRWIDQNAPPQARVLASWGHVAYESHRFVYDGSFLNRLPESGDLRAKYKPEVWVDVWTRPLDEYKSAASYPVVKTFVAPPGSRRAYYFVLVHFREGVAEAGGLLDSPLGTRFYDSLSEAGRRAVQRLLGAGPVSASEIGAPETLEIESTLAEMERKLGELSADQRKLALEKAPWMAELRAKLDALHASKGKG